MPFKFSITHLPKTIIAGTHIMTNMAKAQQDCPALWMSFGEQVIGKLNNSPLLDSENDNAYGVSIMVDENNFEYWAGCVVTSIEGLPEGVEHLILMEGDYVTCTIANLEQLGHAYDSMYSIWPTTQKQYQLDMQAPCFELYPKFWTPNTPFSIYAKVQRV